MITVTFDQFRCLMDFDTEGKFCNEVAFSVKGSEKFSFCWMGKMPDEKTKKDVFWFGLTEDGKNEFDYHTFGEFSSAKVFDGKSLLDLLDDVIILEIDGCDPMERILHYIGEE